MKRPLAWLLWPGFVIAVAGAEIVFTLVDPRDVRYLGAPLDVSALAVYGSGFLFFWMLGIACSALTFMMLPRRP